MHKIKHKIKENLSATEFTSHPNNIISINKAKETFIKSPSKCKNMIIGDVLITKLKLKKESLLLTNKKVVSPLLSEVFFLIILEKFNSNVVEIQKPEQEKPSNRFTYVMQKYRKDRFTKE